MFVKETVFDNGPNTRSITPKIRNGYCIYFTSFWTSFNRYLLGFIQRFVCTNTKWQWTMTLFLYIIPHNSSSTSLYPYSINNIQHSSFIVCSTESAFIICLLSKIPNVLLSTPTLQSYGNSQLSGVTQMNSIILNLCTQILLVWLIRINYILSNDKFDIFPKKTIFCHP